MWSGAERSISVFFELKGIFFCSWHTLLPMPFICVCWSNFFWNVCHLPGVYEHLWLPRVAAANLGNALQEVPQVSVQKEKNHIGSCSVDLCFLKERCNLSLLTAFFTWKKCNIAATIILWLILENRSVIIFKEFFISLYFSLCASSLSHLRAQQMSAQWYLTDVLGSVTVV